MNYKDIQIGDKVRIVQDPDSFSHVIKQFENRVGRVAVKHDYSSEWRVLVAFDDGRNNDLWMVTTTGEYKTLEYTHTGLYSGE